MFFYIPYALMFLGLLALAKASGNSGAKLSAIVVACVWVMWSATVEISGDFEPWQMGIFLDAIAAYALLMPGDAMRIRAAIASLYCGQIAGHTVYGWYETMTPNPPYLLYGEALDWIAWAQILLIGSWAIADILRHRVLHSLFSGRTYSTDTLSRFARGRK